MAHLSSLGANPTLVDVYKAYPGIARHTLGMAEASFKLTDQLSHAECEMLGAYISRLNGCDYCAGIHTEATVAAGLERTVFETDPDTSKPAYGGARWRPVFALMELLTLSPSRVDQDAIDALVKQDWSDDAIIQLTAISCTFNVLNRLVEGLGLSADEAFYQQAGKRLASVGYGGTAKMLGVA